MVGWEGEGRVEIGVSLSVTRAGLVPYLEAPSSPPGPSREIAGVALAIALAADAAADPDGRLAIALGIEGVLAWFRESDRRTHPRHAVTFALAHAQDRLREAGRPVPEIPAR